jgi:hypothetical protein
MIKLQIFDPAMCCSTGVCGPGVDPAMPRFAADVEWLKTKGVEVERYNLAQEVAAFTGNPTVKSTLNAKGTMCLPLILVNGAIVTEGSYPTRRDLAQFTGVHYEEAPTILRVKERSSLVTLGSGKAKDGR